MLFATSAGGPSRSPDMARVKIAAPQPSEVKAGLYNVKENRLKVYERDGYKCRYCAKHLARFTCKIDHFTPVVAGGTNSLDDLVTACLGYVSHKHQRPVGDFLAES